MTGPQPPRGTAPGDRYPGGAYPPGPPAGGAYPPGPPAGGPYAGDPGVGGPGFGATPPSPSSGGATAAPPHAAGGYDDVGQVSVGELVGNVTRDLSTLMRQELALAQAELKAEARKTGKAAGALGAAGFAGYMAVLFLSICLWWALGHLIGNGWSALVVAVLWGIVGAVLYANGRNKLREVNPTPERTVDTLKNVPDALKGEIGGAR
jgi:Putative Actinobacterial Holin-X, holin superfamily III